MPFDLGSTVRLAADCTDPTGVLTTAATAAVTVTLPDGSTASPPASETGTTGRYQADYVATAAGRHTVRWQFTGPAHAYTDMFDVRDAAPPALLSLADARTHLKKNDHGDDDEIREWIEACTRAVEQLVGPVVVRTVTQDIFFTSGRSLTLALTPVVSLVSVSALSPGDTSYDVQGLHLDGATGIVTRLDGGLLHGPLRAISRVGRVVVTANIRAAAKIILQHLWRTRQGPGRPQRGMDDYDVSEPIPGLGFAIPNRAVQLLDPDSLGPEVG
ncbi:hypothetical protein ACIPPM_22125 [Streptomyces sp. NPDC090119]|uniref:hypothetical protein n=1 Tax=Streptomyces sp. NPDC090119 TaxID=3365951 RepID=UPI00380D5B10